MFDWMMARRVKPTASYVNWVGRSVVQVREEARLRSLLRDALPRLQASDPQGIFAHLKSLVPPGILTAVPPTAPEWRRRNLWHMLLPLVIAAACLIIFPIITIGLLGIGVLIFVILLRRHEQTDPIVPQPYDPERVRLLREGEDHDVTNQY